MLQVMLVLAGLLSSWWRQRRVSAPLASRRGEDQFDLMTRFITTNPAYPWDGRSSGSTTFELLTRPSRGSRTTSSISWSLPNPGRHEEGSPDRPADLPDGRPIALPQALQDFEQCDRGLTAARRNWRSTVPRRRGAILDVKAPGKPLPKDDTGCHQGRQVDDRLAWPHQVTILLIYEIPFFLYLTPRWGVHDGEIAGELGRGMGVLARLGHHYRRVPSDMLAKGSLDLIMSKPIGRTRFLFTSTSAD